MNAEAVELVLAHVKAGLAGGSLSNNALMREESLELPSQVPQPTCYCQLENLTRNYLAELSSLLSVVGRVSSSLKAIPKMAIVCSGALNGNV